MLPPRLVRRLVLAPLVIVITIVLVVLFPLLAAVAALAGLAGRSRPRRMRGLRLLWFAAAWLTTETLTLACCLGLWVASGFGARLHTEHSARRHYAVLRRFLGLIYRAGASAFGVRVEVAEPEFTAEEQQEARPARPVIVLSRHAGPGDSILLVHHLLTVYGRRPRVVMKAAMQLDPSVDVLGSRLPNVFIAPGETRQGLFAGQIERLARGLEAEGAVVIFPEGGNWTPGRWRRGIQRLERKGRRDLASRALQMPNLLPPKLGGVAAAIGACPEADVVFVAHAGVDNLVSAGDIWRCIPLRGQVRARWWRVPADQVPRAAGHEDQVKWLYDWWQRIDEWVSQNRPASETVRPAA
jgi:1-acyl-sn-glycerol-3-phosphate acyltransferase